MDYTQLAQAKAEKKYPYLKKRYTFHEPVIETQRQAYIDALNDVKGLYDALKMFDGNLESAYNNMFKAIEQFEKIEP